jgi:hypothetical protein
MNPKQKEFLKLLGRSPDVGDGWRMVSVALFALCEEVAGELPELVEFEKENSRMRLTEKGKGALFALS